MSGKPQVPKLTLNEALTRATVVNGAVPPGNWIGIGPVIDAEKVPAAIEAENCDWETFVKAVIV